MNQRDAASDFDERELRELLKSLKQLSPPLETRIANREAVGTELARALRRRRGQGMPIWWRTMELPWPLVAAMIAVLLGLSAYVVHLSSVANEFPHQVNSKIHEPFERPRTGVTEVDTDRLVSTHSMTYLCGIGTLRTEIKYSPEETQQ
jgi:hypothetical protein